jgi:hypothetical protein
MADGLLEVRPFDCAISQNATVKDIVIKILNIITLYVHSVKGNSDLVLYSERYSCLSSAIRSVRRHIA